MRYRCGSQSDCTETSDSCSANHLAAVFAASRLPSARAKLSSSSVSAWSCMCMRSDSFCQISFSAVGATVSGAVIGALSSASVVACSFSAQAVAINTHPTTKIIFCFIAPTLPDNKANESYDNEIILPLWLVLTYSPRAKECIQEEYRASTGQTELWNSRKVESFRRLRPSARILMPNQDHLPLLNVTYSVPLVFGGTDAK